MLRFCGECLHAKRKANSSTSNVIVCSLTGIERRIDTDASECVDENLFILNRFSKK